MPRSISAPPLPRSARTPCDWPLPPGSALALWSVLAAQAHEGLVVVIADDPQSAWALEDELAFFAGALPVLHFPDWETLPYDAFNPHPRIVSQRIATLHRLPTLERGVLVVPVTALMQHIAPPAHLATGLSLASGDTLAASEARHRLEAAGYRRVPQVADPGDFAMRGSVLDVYPTGAGQPFRVRLADGAIISIKAVDADTQRSQQAIERLALLPAREFPLDPGAVRSFRARLREHIEGDPEACPLYRDMREGTAPAGVESWLPLFFEQTATLFDYLPEQPLFLPLPGMQAAACALWDEACARHGDEPAGRLRRSPDARGTRLSGTHSNGKHAMGNQRNDRDREPIGGPMDPAAAGKTAGSNTQSQGGISHRVAQAAREEFDASAGLPGGLPRVDPPGLSLDEGGRARKGSVEQGFSGDDGGHVSGDSTGVPASRNPGTAADLGAQQDQRVHGMPRDPADRTTGADSPNRGGTAGSPGGPARMASAHMPGQEPDEGVIQGGQSGNDAQRDQQI